MSDNRFGYRAEFDRIDLEWYVVDARGSTMSGPHPTREVAEAWLDEFTERRLDLAAGVGRFKAGPGPLYETGAEWLARATSESKGE